MNKERLKHCIAKIIHEIYNIITESYFFTLYLKFITRISDRRCPVQILILLVIFKKNISESRQQCRRSGKAIIIQVTP